MMRLMKRAVQPAEKELDFDDVMVANIVAVLGVFIGDPPWRLTGEHTELLQVLSGAWTIQSSAAGAMNDPFDKLRYLLLDGDYELRLVPSPVAAPDLCMCGHPVTAHGASGCYDHDGFGFDSRCSCETWRPV